LKDNQYQIYWYILSRNPSIFEPDMILTNKAMIKAIYNKAILLDKIIN